MLLLDACSFRNPFHSQFNSLSLQEIFIHLFLYSAISSERNWGSDWPGMEFIFLLFIVERQREREVIKMTISCSSSERGRKNICFPFRASNNPTGNSLHFLLYATVINSTVYYMQWLAVGPQMTQVMSVEMWKQKTDPHWGNNIQTDCACIRGPSQAGWLTGIKKELLRMTDVYGGW